MLRCTKVEINNLLSLLGEEILESGILDAFLSEADFPVVTALFKGRINFIDDYLVLHYYIYDKKYK